MLIITTAIININIDIFLVIVSLYPSYIFPGVEVPDFLTNLVLASAAMSAGKIIIMFLKNYQNDAP